MPKVKYDNGQEESLTFAKLSNSELYKYIDLLVAGDTPGIIALCAHRPLNWVNRLDPESFAELAHYFFEQVFHLAMKMADRDPIAGLKVSPIRIQLYSMVKTATKEGVFESLSEAGPTSSSTPSADAPSGSASLSEPAPVASAPGATSTT